MKILAVHSFAVHGTASLKVMLSLLGSRILPVPSLYLSGLTNIPGHLKTVVDTESLLRSSLEIAEKREEKLILFVGYLGNAAQVAAILRLIETHKDLIHQLVVDPVCGDHGKAYVSEEIIDAWPQLLEKADWALPNYTEVQLLSGLPIQAETPTSSYLLAFHQRFPRLSFVGTSLPHPEKIKLSMFHQGQEYDFAHEKLQPHFGGTGDVFASHFLQHLFLHSSSPFMAMRQAAMETVAIIRRSIQAGGQDLVLPGELPY